MTHNVNPPPQLRIPRAFSKDPEVRRYFEAKDIFSQKVKLEKGLRNRLIRYKT